MTDISPSWEDAAERWMAAYEEQKARGDAALARLSEAEEHLRDSLEIFGAVNTGDPDDWAFNQGFEDAHVKAVRAFLAQTQETG